MAWTAMAGKHTFVVPDEHQARALADGLGGAELADLDALQLPMQIRVTNIVWQACLHIAVPRAPRDET